MSVVWSKSPSAVGWGTAWHQDQPATRHAYILTCVHAVLLVPLLPLPPPPTTAFSPSRPPSLSCTQLELLAQRQTVLKAAVDSLQDGNTKLRAKLAPLQSEVGVMMANNKQLRDNNSEMRAQIEALTQKLKAAGLIA